MDLKGQSLLEDEEERFDNQRLFPTGSITILNVHVPSNIASKHGKQKLAILKKKSTMLASYVVNGRGYACVGARGMWEIFNVNQILM